MGRVMEMERASVGRVMEIESKVVKWTDTGTTLLGLPKCSLVDWYSWYNQARINLCRRQLCHMAGFVCTSTHLDRAEETAGLLGCTDYIQWH